MTESDSDDEVVIHNLSHTVHDVRVTSAATSALEGCKEDDMTLLALAKPAMARNRSKRKAASEDWVPVKGNCKPVTARDDNPKSPKFDYFLNGAPPNQPTGVSALAEPPAVPVTLSLDDCYNLPIDELLKIYEKKVRGIPLGKGERFEDFEAVDEVALNNMDLYTEMLMNVQNKIMAVTQTIIQELHEHQSSVEAMKDDASGEDLYTEEQCREANNDAAQTRQAVVEADLERKAAEAVLSGSGDSSTQSPVAPLYARAVATGNADRDEACQIIAHMLAPDCKLVGKACAIEEAIFRLWGSSEVRSDYRQRVHALLRLLCPEGLPGVFYAAKTRRKVDGSREGGTTAHDCDESEPEPHMTSTGASHLRGQLWAGQTNIVKFVSDL